MEANGLKSNGSRGSGKRVFSAAIVVLAIGLLVFLYVRYTRLNVSTDDAFVAGRIHTVAPRVQGTVKKVFVEDNQPVNEGDLLVEIDPRDYEVRVAEAEAAFEAERSKLAEYTARLDAARAQIDESKARIETARATLELQQASRRQAYSDLERARRLFEQGVMAQASYEKAQTAYDVAKAQESAASQSLRQAQASLATQEKAVRQAEDAVATQRRVVEQKLKASEAARLLLSYTSVRSPARGYVTRKNVEAGNTVAAGQPLMSVVSLEDVWVIANYKETQLANVRPGQKVTVKVDTYPGRTFDGRVHSIMAGTGSVFSLFPPENATGNYVKVVQRIPVKIVLDTGQDPDHVLRVGMSVRPTIHIKR